MSNPISVFKFGIRCAPIHWRASAVGSIRGVLTADEMKQAAQTTHEAKKAAKFMAEYIAALSLSVIDLIVTGKNLLKAKNLKAGSVSDSAKMSPDEILRQAGYKSQNLIDKNAAAIEKLQFNMPDDVLIENLSKMKKKGLAKSIEHITKINDVLENIHISNRGPVLKNAEQIRDLQKYYTVRELTDILNNVSPEKFESTVKRMTGIQKELLAKNISSGESNAFAREVLTKLKLEHGITEERLKTLRNLDYNKMTPAEYKKIKPEIDAIVNLTKSYDLNKVKPGMMRKYIPVEDMEKYLSGKYTGIGGFIARQDDVLQLKTFNDVFYTMRLDYEGNTFVYNREIAYIDFKSSDYSATYVPIGKRYGGTETFASPFGGMGLIKTENGQLIGEYKIPNGQSTDIEEAAIYMIDKNGKTEKIAVYDRIKQ